MTDIAMTGNFLRSTSGFTIADGGGATWSFDSATNKLSVALSVSAGSVADNAITNAKLADMAQSTIKGRTAGAGIGDPVDLTPTQVKTILALASIDISDFSEAAQDAVLNAGTDSTTIDFTYNDGANTWTVDVIDNSISNAKLRDSGALSLIGRSANSSGDPGDISAAANDTLLRRTANTLSFGQLTAGMFPSTVVPDAALSTNVPLLNALNSFQRSGEVYFEMWDASAGTDVKRYRIRNTGGQFVLSAFNDAATSNSNPILISRTGITIDSIVFTTTKLTQTGDFAVTGKSGFNGTAPLSKPTVTGSKGANAALTSLLTALASYGLLTDSST